MYMELYLKKKMPLAYQNRIKMKLLTLIILTSLLFISSSTEPKTSYTIQLVFCDNRPPVTIVVRSYKQPSNQDIKSYKEALKD